MTSDQKAWVDRVVAGIEGDPALKVQSVCPRLSTDGSRLLEATLRVLQGQREISYTFRPDERLPGQLRRFRRFLGESQEAREAQRSRG